MSLSDELAYTLFRCAVSDALRHRKNVSAEELFTVLRDKGFTAEQVRLFSLWASDPRLGHHPILKIGKGGINLKDGDDFSMSRKRLLGVADLYPSRW